MATVTEFQELLISICDRESSAYPEVWKPKNSLAGHSATAALLAHDFFGGLILRASLVRTPYAYFGAHYWNLANNGARIDFTAAQFGKEPLGLSGEPKHRILLLSQPETKRLYELLKSRAKAKGWEAHPTVQ